MTDSIIGELIDDQFLVQRKLGSGGMGVVYLAEQVDLGRLVAVKLLYNHVTANPDISRARFHREARAASRINHPGSVMIHGFGEWRGMLYMAMEYLEGETVREILGRESTIQGAKAAQLLIQICHVLEAAHGAGVLHRDLKSENIMVIQGVNGEDRVKVVDFGIAIFMARGDINLTAEGIVAGTPSYMSPEQIRGDDLDERCDIYALGIIFYEMLCGQLPYNSKSSTDVLMQHLYNEPLRPADKNPAVQIDPSLEAVALWAISKAPEARPQSAAEFRQELSAALERSDSGGLPQEPQRKQALSAGGRHTRAAEMGIGEPSARPRGADRPFDSCNVVVVEVEDKTFANTLTANLRVHDFSVVKVGTIEEAVAVARGGDASVIVLDLRRAGDDDLRSLEDNSLGEALREGGWLVVAVGPDEAVGLMARALGLGFADYVPNSMVASGLAKTIRNLLRQKRKRKS